MPKVDTISAETRKLLTQLYIECMQKDANDSGQQQRPRPHRIENDHTNTDSDDGSSAIGYNSDTNSANIDQQMWLQLLHHRNEHASDADNQSQVFCPSRFDGYICWPRTDAGETVTAYCPDFVTGFDKRLLAHKECLPNGTWFTHPESGQEWSNYTNCVDVDDLEFRQLVNEFYIKGYVLSLFTLVISLAIFMSFRSLRCTRIRIHIQLFTSLALTCITWLLWYKLIIERPDIIRDNSFWCIGLHLIMHYLMIANYFWMFCEGLHLHLVLVVVFIKDAVAMRIFLLIGWLAPTLLVTGYAVTRYNYTEDLTHCWMEDSISLWILKVPVLASLLASIVFLINVVRVLCNKLHPGTAQLAPLALQKALRATLILVPLFGLHYILLPFRPEAGSTFDKAYQITSALLISLQGVCVSCLFCFANHDVLFELRCLLSRLFPNLFAPQLETNSKHDAPQATQTRDVIV